MATAVGLDIGGGGVRGARVDSSGAVGPIERLALPDREVHTIVAAVRELVDRLGGARQLGVGVPGFVTRGVVLASPNFPSWRSVPLGDLLADAVGVPVHLANDANAACFGAWMARGASEDLVLLTLGTGVGGGIITGGRLLRGAGGTGAEVGHLWIGGERRCGCGGVGCLETICSTVGLAASAREAGVDVEDGAAVVRAADQGHAWAVDACDRAADALGRGLVTLVNLFNPDAVILTGGLAGARHRLAPRAEAWLRDNGVAASVDRVEVVWEGRAETFAILGAAALARPPG